MKHLSLACSTSPIHIGICYYYLKMMLQSRYSDFQCTEETLEEQRDGAVCAAHSSELELKPSFWPFCSASPRPLGILSVSDIVLYTHWCFSHV